MPSCRHLVLYQSFVSSKARRHIEILPGVDAASCALVCSHVPASPFRRDYNVGEPPEPAVLAAAAEAALVIPPDTEARQFAPETDIVRADLVLVMDKYTAADVLREVGCPTGASTCNSPVMVHNQPYEADGAPWHGTGCGIDCCSVRHMGDCAAHRLHLEHEFCAQLAHVPCLQASMSHTRPLRPALGVCKC